MTDVLSEPHVYALVDSAQFFKSFGSVTVDFCKLLRVLFRVGLQGNKILVLIESSIDLSGSAIGILT